jgi:hypothetical protein
MALYFPIVDGVAAGNAALGKQVSPASARLHWSAEFSDTKDADCSMRPCFCLDTGQYCHIISQV